MIRQCLELTRISLSSLPARLGPSQMIVIGTACIVAVASGLLSLAAGLQAAMQHSSLADRGVVLLKGSVAENTSYYTGSAVGRILQLDHVEAASGELLIHVPLPGYEAGEEAALVILRGLDQSWRDVRPEIRMIAGRFFQPGKREVIIGRRLLTDYPGLAVGDAMPIWQGSLTVVGHFESAGGLSESEAFTDLAMLQNAYGRGNAVNTVRVRLDRPGSAAAVQAQIDRDPTAGVNLVMEDELHAGYVEERKAMVEAFAYWILGIMAVGAIVASFATMYAAVQSRTRELAMLKVLGFQGLPVVASVLIEAMLLATAGAVLGAALVFAAFDGVETSTRGNMGNAMMFTFQMTPATVMIGIAIALALGLVSGVTAGIRASRVPVLRALARR